VCDHARYYQNRELAQGLAHTRLVPVLLPPYSPHRKRPERLCKLLRQKITPCFYRPKGPFRQAVRGFYDRLPEFQPELASFLTRNFHILHSQLPL
jgi:hypothetical protein